MSRTLPVWLERWFGIEPAETGEGTVWGLEHAWGWAPWITVLFIAAVAVALVAIYLREAGSTGRAYRLTLAGIRLALVAVVLCMLAELALSLQRTGLPYVVVVVDDSASMSLVDQYDDEQLAALVADRLEEAELAEGSRLNLAKSILLGDDAALVARIEKGRRLRVYALSDAARAITGSQAEILTAIEQLAADGASTRLGEGLRQVLNDLRGTPPAALVVLTDGINTAGEPLAEAAAYAQRKGVPLFAVALGNDEPLHDLRLHDLLVDEVVFVDDVVNFEFKLTATGYRGEQVQIALRADDDMAPLAETTVTVGNDGEAQRVRLPYRPREVGDFRFVLEVEPRDDEVEADNNSQSRMVSVRREQIRVLLAQAYPSYEFRYLKNMLERDSTIELDTFLQEADPEYSELDETALRVFPVRRDELFAYDVIIFGDVNPAFLSATVLEYLVEFVSESGKGGGMILIAGPQYMPSEYGGTSLETLIPVELSRAQSTPPETISDAFTPRLTPLGTGAPHLQLGDSSADSATIWQQLPGLYWLYDAAGLKPAARVLAEHPTQLMNDGRPMPVICLQYVGAGKVLFHNSDDTWRWRRLLGDVYFARYWVQAVRYLSRTKLLGADRAAELSTDRREYQTGDSVRFRVQFVDDRTAPAADDGVQIVVESHGAQNRRLTMTRGTAGRGVFEGTLSQLPEGSYHAWVAAPGSDGRPPSTDFEVVAPPGEFERVQVDSNALRHASELTGGHHYTLDTVRRLAKDLPRGRQIPVESLPRIDLWNRWPLVLLFVGLITTEWVLRKRKGML